ncbi:hypothetical protein FHG87_024537 [Trinorchestia longiramus]|nr:hypothetical protein FHG87_024537 [Trinorchestia longiramus]
MCITRTFISTLYQHILPRESWYSQEPHRTLTAGCTYWKTIINQKQDDEQKQKEQQTHNAYAEIAKHAIQQTNPPQHALTLTNQTHLKLTALIFEAHIAALDKTQKSGNILSKSLKTNFDIDTTFPDRDSAAIFNFYYDKTGTQQPQTKKHFHKKYKNHTNHLNHKNNSHFHHLTFQWTTSPKNPIYLAIKDELATK